MSIYQCIFFDFSPEHAAFNLLSRLEGRARPPGEPMHLGLGECYCQDTLARPAARAATPGLPFSEDFADASLRDDSLTNANCSTEE